MTVEKWLEDSVKSADDISKQGSKSNFGPVEKSKFSSHKPQEENSVSNIEKSSKVDVSSDLSDPNRILYTNHKYTNLHLKSIETMAGSNDKVVKAKNDSKKLSRQACKNVPEDFIQASDSNFSTQSFISQEDHSVSKIENLQESTKKIVNDKMETEVEKDEILDLAKTKKNLDFQMFVYEDHEEFSFPIWDMDNKCNIFATIEVVEDCLEISEQFRLNTGYIFAENILFRSIYCEILPDKSSRHGMVEFLFKFWVEKFMPC